MRIRERSGFTLIELLVTLAIMALVMTALMATLHSTVQARDDAQVEIATVSDGPRILDMIERDLRSIHVYNLKGGDVLRGKSESPGGMRGDRIDFVCCTDSARRIPGSDEEESDAQDVASDLNEVGYRLRTSSLSSDFLEIWRREDLFVDDQPFEGGTYEKVHERVQKFTITYLDHVGEKAAEKSDWDMAEEPRLPGAIKIELELQTSPDLVGGFVETTENALRIHRYTRVIAFHDDETVALAVRPSLPTKITGRNDGGAGGAKGGLDGAAGSGKDGLMEVTRGENSGGSLLDAVGGGGGELPGGGAPGSSFDIGGNGPAIKINLGPNGELSPGDEAKIEKFMNEYRGRFSGPGGFGGGGSGGGRGGGGTGGNNGGAPPIGGGSGPTTH